MARTRRQFLRIAGSATVIVAAAATGFAVTRTPDKALAPWRSAGAEYDDPRFRALSHAVLAPNPHNMQPWLVTLEGGDGFALSADRTRLLPHTDPYSRQIVIGFGCFLELMRMAAAEDGYRAEVVLFPDGAPGLYMDDRPVARVRLVRDTTLTGDPLFAQVFDRRTNKEPFDTARNVSRGDMEAIAAACTAGSLAGVIADPGEIDQFRDLTWRAHLVEVETPRTYMESVNVMRIGKAEIEANPDGIDLGGPFLEALKLAGVMTHDTLADMSSSAYAQGIEIYRAILGSAMGYVHMATRGNTRQDQIAAGADWLRMNLKATELGLGFHPLSQALQEYPEMAALYADMHARLGHSGRTVQMFARVGYGPTLGPSPRWPIEAKIVPA